MIDSYEMEKPSEIDWSSESEMSFQLSIRVYHLSRRKEIKMKLKLNIKIKIKVMTFRRTLPELT